MNQALNTLNSKIASCDEKMKKIPHGNLAKPLQGLNGRMKRKAKICEEMYAAYKDYAGKVRAIDTLNADTEVLHIKVAESELAQETADTCHQISMSMSDLSDIETAMRAEGKLLALKEITQEMRTAREVLRVRLTHKYSKEFPTLEETASNTASADAGEKKHGEGDDGDKPAAASSRSAMRTWSDRSGKHRIKARFLGMENGKAKLEQPDGTVLRIPPAKLSDKDRNFINEIDE